MEKQLFMANRLREVLQHLLTTSIIILRDYYPHSGQENSTSATNIASMYRK